MIRPPLWKIDVCLMNAAMEMDITLTQLDRLNCVQKWFNVKYLSELCNEEGTMIRPGILTGSHMQQQYVRDTDGPKQTKPNTYSWKFWKQLLKQFTTNGTRQELKQKLGKWTKHHSKHRRWPAYIHEDKVFEYCITETEEKKWTVYYKYGTQLRFEDELDFNEFNYKLGTPTQIKLLSNET